jgi:insertion element IS1 protein InsB
MNKSASGLWESLPPVDRQCAVSYTDFWSAYGTVFTKKRHKAVGKDTCQTNYIEIFNNTMRPRISLLVIKTILLFEKLSNHLGSSLVFYS